MNKIKGTFLTHSGLIFLATAVVNFSNMLYQLFMVRSLSPSDYAAVNSLLAILVIISVPLGTFQTGLVTFISKFFAQQQLGKIKFILKEISKHILTVAFILFFLLILESKTIASYLQIEYSTPVILIAWSLLFAAFAPILMAGLQGIQKFISLAIIMVITGSSKLLVSVTMVWLNYGINGALSGFLIAAILTIFLSLILLRPILEYKAEPEKGIIKDLYLHFLPVGISLLCLLVLTSSDIVLVKHYFNPTQAGYYSVASLIGKIILFLPAAITTVMFPKTSYLLSQDKTTEARNLLKKSLYYVGFLCGSAALVCIFFTSLILKLLSGKVYPQSIPLARLFALAMFFFALFGIILFYHISSRQTRFIYPLIISTVAQIILIFLFHNSPLQVISIVAVNAFVLFLINLKLVFKKLMFRYE